MRSAFQHTKIILSAGGVLVLCLFFYLLFQNPTAYRLAGSHLFRNFYYKDKKTLMGWVRKGQPPYKTKPKTAVSEMWETATGLKIIK